MAFTHDVTVRDDFAAMIRDAADGGTIVILDADDTVLVTYNLLSPAFTNPNNGSITLEGLPMTEIATNPGEAAKFECRDAFGSVIYAGTVASSGGDLNINNVSIAQDQEVEMTEHSYTATP